MLTMLATTASNINDMSVLLKNALESAVIFSGPLLWLGRKFNKVDAQLSRLNYAIFNDGRTGLKNIVDDNIPQMQADLIVIKTKMGIKDDSN